MLTESSDAVLLFGLEPDFDFADNSDAVEHLSQQKFVAAFTPYKTYALETCADLLLPIGTFAETSGTFVNCEGRWQSFAGVANPVGEARPGWKVLRVLANLLDVADSDYQTSLEILDELKKLLGEIAPDNSARHEEALAKAKSDGDAADGIDVPIYQVDSIVRRAVALQLTPAARRSRGELA
jgi:NADH-quinone oxidoreductase subunit G